MKIAIFDFDGTLFQKETLPFIVKYYSNNKYSKGKLIKFYIRVIALTIKYKLKLDLTLDKEKYRSIAAKIFMYLFEDMDKGEIIKFFSDCTTEIIKHFNPAVLDSIKDRKAENYHIVICSGANTLLLNEVTKYVEFDTVIGTELYFLKDGSFDYNAQIIITTGKNKPIALLERFKNIDIDWENSYAYGDSYYDYDIMNLTGNPVAVNPDDGLRRLAMENDWVILGEK